MLVLVLWRACLVLCCVVFLVVCRVASFRVCCVVACPQLCVLDCNRCDAGCVSFVWLKKKQDLTSMTVPPKNTISEIVHKITPQEDLSPLRTVLVKSE